MMLHFGAFITESSGHLSEYLPYYRRNATDLKKYTRDKYLGESRFYASNWPTWRKTADTDRLAMLRGEKRSTGTAALSTPAGSSRRVRKTPRTACYGNVMNNDGTGRGSSSPTCPPTVVWKLRA